MIDLNGKNAVQLWPGMPREIELDRVLVIENVEFQPGSPPIFPVNFSEFWLVIRRVAPWLKNVFLVPTLAGSGTNLSWGGWHSQSQNSVWLKYSSVRPHSIFSTLYHELFHSAYVRLPAEVRSRLYQYVSLKSRNFGDPDYVDVPAEKSARLFQNFALFLEGGGVFFRSERHEMSWLTDLFFSVYSGQFALELAAAERREAFAARRAEHRAAAWRGVKSLFA